MYSFYINALQRQN